MADTSAKKNHAEWMKLTRREILSKKAAVKKHVTLHTFRHTYTAARLQTEQMLL